MPISTIVTRYAVCIALALFQAGEAAADEIWECAFTRSRVHWHGRDMVFYNTGAFFLRVKPPVLDLVVYSTSTHRSFVPISYSVTENSGARLAGIVQFHLVGGVTNTGDITLEKRSGRIRQGGRSSDKNARREVSEGTCSKTPLHDLPADALAPPEDASGARSSPQPVIPVRKPPLVRKRPA